MAFLCDLCKTDLYGKNSVGRKSHTFCQDCADYMMGAKLDDPRIPPAVRDAEQARRDYKRRQNAHDREFKEIWIAQELRKAPGADIR